MIIQIEEKKYNNRSEFRGRANGSYLRFWEHDGYCGGYSDYLYTAYRDSWILTYAYQRRKALKKCHELISSYKKSHEKAKVILHADVKHVGLT